MKYYVFGSQSSQDLDILVLVEKIGTIQENKIKVTELQEELKSISSKAVNVNLGIEENGVLVQVFKGTLDEVNNSVMDTYSLHPQMHSLSITQRMKRDVSEKVLRSVRIVLSNLSRTHYRKLVKTALQGDVKSRIEALKNIDLRSVTTHDKYPILDVHKTLAFQMGQAVGLIVGCELYTKEDIAKVYPHLGAALRRETSLNEELEAFKRHFIEQVEAYYPKLSSLEEKPV